MAFVASIDNLQMVRASAFAPGNTGGGNPRPDEEQVVRQPKGRPAVRIGPKCTPRAYAYPKYGAIPLGPNGRGRYHLLRYACLRSSRRWFRLLQAISQNPLYHTLPLDQLPVGLIDRNPSPVSGQSQVPFRRATGISNDTLATE